MTDEANRDPITGAHKISIQVFSDGALVILDCYDGDMVVLEPAQVAALNVYTQKIQDGWRGHITIGERGDVE